MRGLVWGTKGWNDTLLVTVVTCLDGDKGLQGVWMDQGEVMCQQEELSLVLAMVMVACFFQISVSFLFSSLSSSDMLLPSSSCFFPPFEPQCPSPSYPCSLLVAFPIILQIHANTQGLWADSNWYLCLAPEPSWVLCILFHFILVYCISSFCIALNCALRNSMSLFNDLAELLSELTINFTEHLFVSLNFVLLWILSLAVHGFIALLDSFNLV